MFPQTKRQSPRHTEPYESPEATLLQTPRSISATRSSAVIYFMDVHLAPFLCSNCYFQAFCGADSQHRGGVEKMIVRESSPLAGDVDSSNSYSNHSFEIISCFFPPIFRPCSAIIRATVATYYWEDGSYCLFSLGVTNLYFLHTKEITHTHTHTQELPIIQARVCTVRLLRHHCACSSQHKVKCRNNLLTILCFLYSIFLEPLEPEFVWKHF